MIDGFFQTSFPTFSGLFGGIGCPEGKAYKESA
jgi:hypothetical protein